MWLFKASSIREQRKINKTTRQGETKYILGCYIIESTCSYPYYISDNMNRSVFCIKMNNNNIQKAAENILQTLIALPEFLRKSILQGRIKEFCTIEKKDQYETISIILKTAASVDAYKLSILAKTWMEVISELDSAQIIEIFRIYCEEIVSHPEVIQKLPMDSIVHIFCTLEDKKKEKLIDCLKEVFLCFPNRYKIISLIPESGLNALKIQ